MAKKAAKKTVAKKVAAKKPAAKKAVDKSMKITATPADSTDKAHLAGVVQTITGSTGIAAKETVDALLATLGASLKKNQKVQLLGFGTFEVAKRKARKGRNPATGESIRIKASKTVRFRPGTKLKATV